MNLTSFTDAQFIRFLAVGALNAAFGYGCIWLFLSLGFDYRLALLFGTIAGVLFNFKTTGRLVFRSSNNRLIVRFVLVYVVVYGVNVALVRALALLGIEAKLAAAITIAPMAVLGYVLNRRYVFQAPPEMETAKASAKNRL